MEMNFKYNLFSFYKEFKNYTQLLNIYKLLCVLLYNGLILTYTQYYDLPNSIITSQMIVFSPKSYFLFPKLIFYLPSQIINK